MITITRRMVLAFLIAIPAAFSAEKASALEVITGQVTSIEASYMPDTVKFYLSGGSASCAAGHVLVWRKSLDSNKAIYAGLLSALSNEKRVRLYTNDGDASCTGQFIYFSE